MKDNVRMVLPVQPSRMSILDTFRSYPALTCMPLSAPRTPPTLSPLGGIHTHTHMRTIDERAL